MHTIVFFFVGLVVGLALGALVASLWWRGRAMQLKGERDTVVQTAVAEITQASARAAADQLHQVTQHHDERQGADLDERSKVLQVAVSDLVRPVAEQLERYRRQVDELQHKNAQLHGELKGQIEQLVLANAGLKKETASLVTALRRPEVRGAWGEQQLRRIVELAGMLEHCDFDEQVPMVGATGAVQRPDLVVHLPNARQVIVDAKVPLDAFLEGAETEDPVLRDECMKRHARQLREHTEALSKRRYQLGYEGSVDFVVAFVP
ncbi:MAG: DNA recombination protein RmuC, partial [Acidimicrobiales bacterium]